MKCCQWGNGGEGQNSLSRGKGLGKDLEQRKMCVPDQKKVSMSGHRMERQKNRQQVLVAEPECSLQLLRQYEIKAFQGGQQVR